MRPWHDLYVERRARLKQNLHILQPTHGAILELCQIKLLNNKLLDISDYRCVVQDASMHIRFSRFGVNVHFRKKRAKS